MKNLFDYEKTQSATVDLPFGAFKNESAPGQQNGTDIVAEHIQDLAYPLYQVLQLAGITPDGELEDGNNKTQFIQALTNIGICRHSDKVVYNKSVFVWTILGNDFVLYRSIKDENSAELNDASSWQKILEIGSDNVLKFAVDTNIELENSVESYLTNCILEIPQNIKYTLEDGVLTIKAGTIITVPYGTTDQSTTYPVGATFLNNNFKVVKTYFNNGKFFVQAEVQADRSVSSTAADSNRLVGLAPQSHGTYNYTDTACYSGTTAPTNTDTLAIWYDTANNVIKQTNNSGDSWNEAYWCLPLLLVERANQEWTQVLNVFNGMGYIGSTAWVDKGVKLLSANGRNADGILNNKEITINNLIIRTNPIGASLDWFRLGESGNGNQEFIDMSKNTYYEQEEEPITARYSVWYKPSENITRYVHDTAGEWVKCYYIRAVEATADSTGKITSFKPKQPFRAVDYNEYRTEIDNKVSKSGDSMSGALTVEGTTTLAGALNANGNSTFTQPIVSTGNYIVTQGNLTIKNLANNASTDAIIAINGDTNKRCGALRFQNGDGFNEVSLGAAPEDGSSVALMGLRNTNGAVYAYCPTYTANYADSSAKIVTTAYMANRWTTTKATTTSTASKARPAVVIQNYVSGYNWYRVWSDGWIEQGGRVYMNNYVNQTLNFNKAFTTTNYTIVSAGEGNNADVNLGIMERHTAYVIVDNGANVNYNWYACGY